MKTKNLMTIKLFLNDDGTICFGLRETKINTKITITKNAFTVNLKDLYFHLALYNDNPYVFETQSIDNINKNFKKNRGDMI